MKVVHAFASFLLVLSASDVAAEVCSRVYPARTPDPQAKCDSEGSLRNPTIIGTTRRYTPAGARAQAQCRNGCLENGSCAAYSFNRRTGDCNQYPQKPAVQGFSGGNTGVFFWNRNCWEQNFTTSQALINPGFDNGNAALQPWTLDSDNDNYLPSRSRPGSNDTAYSALLSVGTRIGTTIQSVRQSFSVCPNTTYFIQPMYRYLGAANTSLAQIGIDLAGANANQGSACALGSSDANQVNATGGWSTVLDPGASWLTLQASETALAWSLSLYLTFPNHGQSQNVSDPQLDRFQFDVNIAETKTPVARGGAKCGFSYRPVAGGNF